MLKKSAMVMALLSGVYSQVWAQEVDVSNVWVRGTVAAQKATGAFMELKSTAGATLVGVSSPVGMSQIHEMSMDGGVMRMREVKKLDLPAGQTVALKPGGYHIMLMDLKKPLTNGEVVPITLKIQAKDGKISEQTLKAEVRPLGNAVEQHHHHH